MRPISLKYFHQFVITLPGSATYFLEVGARVSIKVTIKMSLRGKKNSGNSNFMVVFLKQKRRTASKKFKTFIIN